MTNNKHMSPPSYMLCPDKGDKGGDLPGAVENGLRQAQQNLESEAAIERWGVRQAHGMPDLMPLP